ncbi:MAG: hypothetical protein V3U93_05055 [Alphaproteobacteria bacterium]
MKPIDWPAIREACNKRVKREGWDPSNPEAWGRRVAETETAARLANPQTRGDKQIVALGNRTEKNMQALLARVASGAKQTTVARSLGISQPALANWKKADPGFATLLDAAEAVQHVNDETEIAKARNRGDWKAALTRLERGKHTKDDWAAPEKVSGSGGITVVFNWSRDEPPKQPIVDITPTRREIEAEASAAT